MDLDTLTRLVLYTTADIIAILVCAVMLLIIVYAAWSILNEVYFQKYKKARALKKELHVKCHQPHEQETPHELDYSL